MFPFPHKYIICPEPEAHEILELMTVDGTIEASLVVLANIVRSRVGATTDAGRRLGLSLDERHDRRQPCKNLAAPLTKAVPGISFERG